MTLPASRASEKTTLFTEPVVAPLQKIGIYGGTFDPIHYAHLILAREALEQLQLKKIVFVPAATSPGKGAPIASSDVRWEMLLAAIAGDARFEADDLELRRPPPSYTITTIEELAIKHREAQLFFLIGDDNLPQLPTWRDFGALQRMVTFVVLRRAEKPIAHEYLSVERRIDISATEIRNRVARSAPIRYLVPPVVEEMIRTRQTYREVSK
jgi:nicotinate-nucleotide adenylyltransferase